jgi:septum formation protein
MKIVLASNSKNRKDLLDMLGFVYEIKKSRKDEISNATNPFEYVAELSKTKALDVLEQMDYKALIIAADTIITMDDKIYEKPKTKDEAKNNLLEMSGRTTTAITGMTIIDMEQDIIITSSDSVDISFKEIPEEDIDWYVENDPYILDRCGYSLVGKASLFVNKIEGDYNIAVGLSLNKLHDAIKQLGYKLNDIELK